MAAGSLFSSGAVTSRNGIPLIDVSNLGSVAFTGTKVKPRELHQASTIAVLPEPGKPSTKIFALPLFPLRKNFEATA